MARADETPRLPEAPRLPPAMPRSGVSAEARLALRQVLGDTERGLADAFRYGADARALTRVRAQAVEHVVVHVWRACVGEPADAALFAVGGFGRGALFPYSDLDLLVLIEPGALARHARVLEAFFACLWDLGLKPGHAVRELGQCRALAETDVTVFTNLLDARRLAGSELLAFALEAMVDDKTLWPAAEYFAAKRAEQGQRFARFNDTAYNLEPNLKEGPGGLRTLDLLRWLGRRITRAADFDALVAQGVLDPTERAALERSEATLRRYRYALHLAAGRAEERLLFDHQRALAAELGFRDEHEKNLAVEQFMRSSSASWSSSIRRADRRARSTAISSPSARASSRARRPCSSAVRARWSRHSRSCSITPNCAASRPRRCAGCNARSRGTAATSPTTSMCSPRSSRCCAAARRRSPRSPR